MRTYNPMPGVSPAMAASFNARVAEALLFDAAPDLLAALEALVEGRPTAPPPTDTDGPAMRNWRLFQNARAAIARATGATS